MNSRRAWLLSGLWLAGLQAAPADAPGHAAKVSNDRATKLPERPRDRGAHIYDQVCSACHQPDGKGVLEAFPPLAGSDYLMADKARSIDVVLFGLSGEIRVNGETFDGVMPGLELNDADVASVLTYVRGSFGNSGDPVTAEEVRARRKDPNPRLPEKRL
jgi:nitrite reductase (NO-forming)